MPSPHSIHTAWCVWVGPAVLGCPVVLLLVLPVQGGSGVCIPPAGGRCCHPLLTMCPALTRCAAAARPQGRSVWALLWVQMPLPGFRVGLGSPAGPWVPGWGSAVLGAARVCYHGGCTRVCPLWAGCVCMELRVHGTVCCWQYVHSCVCTPGAVQGVHVCVTRVCVCVCESPLCLCVHTCACVEHAHVCHVCVCVSALCARVLVTHAQQGCPCPCARCVHTCWCMWQCWVVPVPSSPSLRAPWRLPVPGGPLPLPSAGPWRVSGFSEGLPVQPPPRRPSLALIPRPGCGKQDPSPAPAAAAPPRPRSGLPGQGAPRPGWPVTLPAGSGFLAPQPLPRSAP